MMRDYYKKMPGDRKDGWKLRNVPLFFTVVPFIMRTRLDSQDYYAETLDAEPMMDFIKAHKEDIPNISMMTIFVAAMVRMISQRPALNRFVVHNKLYAHNSIEISIAIKRNMSDDGEETMIKPSFDPRDTLPDVQRRLEEAIEENEAQAGWRAGWASCLRSCSGSPFRSSTSWTITAGCPGS